MIMSLRDDVLRRSDPLLKRCFATCARNDMQGGASGVAVRGGKELRPFFRRTLFPSVPDRPFKGENIVGGSYAIFT